MKSNRTKTPYYRLFLLASPLALAAASCGGQDETPYTVPYRIETDAGVCGDGVVSGAEACDGTDFAHATCASATMGQASKGELRCNDKCELDVTHCTTAGGVPGNGGSGGSAGGLAAGGAGGAGGSIGAGGSVAGGAGGRLQ